MYKTIIYFSFNISSFLVSLIQLKARIKLKKSVKFVSFIAVSYLRTIPFLKESSSQFELDFDFSSSGEKAAKRGRESIHVSFRFFFAALNTNYGTWRAEFVAPIATKRSTTEGYFSPWKQTCYVIGNRELRS